MSRFDKHNDAPVSKASLVDNCQLNRGAVAALKNRVTA
jgi:hypothetical protein